MLGAEANENDAALADLDLNHGGAFLQQLAAFEIAAEEDVLVVARVAGDDVAVEARVRDSGLEGG